MRLISRRGALLALGTATLAACAREETPEDGKTMDLSGINDAVEASSPRVVRVTKSERVVDGLGHGVSMELRVDGADAMSSEDLDAIVKAIWLSAPWEPNGISLMAFADDAEEEPVDLRAAAKELTPTFSDSYGEGGISMIAMQKRYGEWKKPA